MSKREIIETGTGDYAYKPERLYRINTDCSQEELLAAAKLYARAIVREHGLNVSVSAIEWKICHRSKRRAAAVFVRDETPVAIKLTWEYFQQKGWGKLTDTIRHELIHVHLLREHQDASHGPRFRKLAEKLDTALKCDNFADPKWEIVCQSCGVEFPRYKKSKVVKNIDQYRCGECGGSLGFK